MEIFFICVRNSLKLDVRGKPATIREERKWHAFYLSLILLAYEYPLFLSDNFRWVVLTPPSPTPPPPTRRPLIEPCFVFDFDPKPNKLAHSSLHFTVLLPPDRSYIWWRILCNNTETHTFCNNTCLFKAKPDFRRRRIRILGISEEKKIFHLFQPFLSADLIGQFQEIYNVNYLTWWKRSIPG